MSRKGCNASSGIAAAFSRHAAFFSGQGASCQAHGESGSGANGKSIENDLLQYSTTCSHLHLHVYYQVPITSLYRQSPRTSNITVQTSASVFLRSILGCTLIHQSFNGRLHTSLSAIKNLKVQYIYITTTVRFNTLRSGLALKLQRDSTSPASLQM